MSLTFHNKSKGRLLYQDENKLIKAINHRLFKSRDNGKTWKESYRLTAHSFIDTVAFQHHLICRLLRKGFHHLNSNQENVLGLIYNKRVAILQNDEKHADYQINGSRPLSLSSINNEFIFGEYRSNPERSTIGIYAVHEDKELYKKIEMTGIRHIHGIYQDPYTNEIWITTGDTDEEAAIYRTNSAFNKLEKLLYGSQQTRAIKLLFTLDYIYFGSDAPNEPNYIYRMHRDTKEVDRLIQVGSSVFHGCKVGEWLFFSTAIEPSNVNTTKYAEVWGSPNGTEWKCILQFKKDIWPMKYFQYGQVFFPNGQDNGKDLWVSPFATKYSNTTFSVSINDIKNLFK